MHKFLAKSSSITLINLALIIFLLLGSDLPLFAAESIFDGKNTIKTKLILRVEERNFQKDEAYEYRVMEDGYAIKSIMHYGDAHKSKLFDTKIAKISNGKLSKARALIEQLRQLKYGNSFPWRESLREKGSVVKIEFSKSMPLDCYQHRYKKEFNISLTVKDDNELTSLCSSGQFPVTFLYYTGHRQSPKLFKEVLNYVQSL